MCSLGSCASKERKRAIIELWAVESSWRAPDDMTPANSINMSNGEEAKRSREHFVKYNCTGSLFGARSWKPKGWKVRLLKGLNV